MASAAIAFTLDYYPFVSSDFDKLEMSIRGQAPFVPIGELRTNPTFKAITIAANGDIQFLGAQMLDPIQDVVTYCTHLRAVFINDQLDSGFTTLWATQATYSLEPTLDPTAGNAPLYNGIDACTMSGDITTWDGQGGTRVMMESCAPPMNSFPGPLVQNLKTSGFSYLASIMPKVATYDAVAAGNTTCWLDARFLAFPQSAVQAGSFFQDRMYFRTGNNAAA